MKNKNQGITLIALVITIIIILILAGVTIAVLSVSELFEKTRFAKEKYLEEKMKEEVQLIIMEAQVQKGDSLSYEYLCQNYLIPNNYSIEDYVSFGKITKNSNKTILYIDKNTFDLSFEKKYEVCKVILQTDNDIDNFENINIILKDASTGKIMQQYTLLDNEKEHDFFVEKGIRYTISVSDLKNENYEYTTPAETESIEALEDNTREIKMSYKERIAYLYNYGCLCTSISGGWDNNFSVVNSKPYTTVNPIFNNNNMTLNLSSTKGIECVIGTTNKVDITNYSKVCINYEYTEKPAFSRPLCVFSDKSSFPASYVAQITNNACANGVSSIDISNITGSYYIGSGIWNSFSTTGVENSRIIYQVWLEK